jgi:serine/threonine-protein kinase
VSETIKDPGPPLPDRPGGTQSTKRICPACGSAYLGAFHDACPAGARAPATPAGPDSAIDELPAEAKPFDRDPSRQLNQYVLVRQVGRGGMGAVWKAWDRTLTRWSAIKFLLAHEQRDVLRFQREAKLAARLRHPNIAAIYEVGQAKSAQLGSDVTHYLAMEFIDGKSLGEATLAQDELLDLIIKVCAGLSAAHRGGVIHRDLKPQNIMLNAEGWPYVMDFGLAKALQGDSSLSVSGSIMGTPAYMPPEQAEGRLDEIDARSDVYSLGATLYAALCGRPPFSGQTPLEILNRVSQEDPPVPSSLNRNISPALEAVILKAMAKRREDRYASAADFARDLQKVRANEPISAAAPGAYDPTLIAPSSRPKAARKSGVGKGILIGSAVAIAVLSAAAALLSGGPTVRLSLPSPVPRPPTVVAKTPAAATPIEQAPTLEAKPEPKPETKPEPKPEPKAVAPVEPPKPEPKPEVKPPPPPPPPEPPKIDEDERDWKQTLPLLAYETWAPGDVDLVKRSNALLGRYLSKEAGREATTARWFSSEIERARSIFREGKRSPEQQLAVARRICSWCDATASAVTGIPGLQDVGKAVGALRAEAEPQTRGSFSLKISPDPFAQVVRITCDGRPLPLRRKDTPLVLEKLDVGDYEIEVAHPDLGRRIVKIAAKDLKDGLTYIIYGKMSDAALSVRESTK